MVVGGRKRGGSEGNLGIFMIFTIKKHVLRIILYKMHALKKW